MLLIALVGFAAETPDFRELVRANRAAVVTITVLRSTTLENPDDAFLEQPSTTDPALLTLLKQLLALRNLQAAESGRLQGSGFIISAQGQIVTAAHLLVNAGAVSVRLHTGQEYPARIIGIDPLIDIALLKIDTDNLAKVRLGDSDRVEAGDWVLAIGAPYGFDGSASQGIVSAVKRYLSEANLMPLIQSDVAINPGSSGGPLFNRHGQVIGVNAQLYSETSGYSGLSFAIPINHIMPVVRDLQHGRKIDYGWLGIALQNLDVRLQRTFGLTQPTGVLVTLVADDSSASQAGFHEGDVITHFNGQPIANAEQLILHISRAPVGRQIPINLVRAGQAMQLQATIEALPELDPTISELSPRGRALAKLGARLINLDDKERAGYGLSGERGVLVEQVTAGPALEAGLEAGDIILAVAHNNIADVAQLQQLLPALPAQRPLPLLILRGDQVLYLGLLLPSA